MSGKEDRQVAEARARYYQDPAHRDIRESAQMTSILADPNAPREQKVEASRRLDELSQRTPVKARSVETHEQAEAYYGMSY